MLTELQEPLLPLGCSLATPCCASPRQGRLSPLLSHPHPFIPFLWAWPRPVPQAALHAAHCLPLGLSRAPRESSLSAGSSDQSPGAGRDSRKHCLNSLASLQTLEAMDTMLETMVLSFPASRVSEELQNVLQVWHG